MDLSADNQRIVVVLGPPRPLWPEPLAGMAHSGQIALETAGSIYDAACRLARVPASDARRPVLLLDPQVLTRRDLEAVGVIAARRTAIVGLLPITPAAGPCAAQAGAYQVLLWQELVQALQAVPLAAADHTPATLTSPATDNIIALNPAPGNAVTWDVPLLYDEAGTQPLLSEQEIQALLGT